jgi:putative oxidoreductase
LPRSGWPGSTRESAAAASIGICLLRCLFDVDPGDAGAGTRGTSDETPGARKAATSKAKNEAGVMENDINDGVILAARLLLAALFLIFGWRKLTDYSGTVSRMVQDGARFPVLATPVAIFMELPVAFAVAVGAFTRLSALLLVFYTLGTALIAHHYWTMTGANKIDSMESFYKNLSITGGFLLLCITGAGKYSIDAMLGL